MLALLLAGPVSAQEPAAKKKPVAAKKKKSHQKPTAEQIRRFNDLQKKQKQ
ncbi:MAG TPA: hypothetical protein VJQ58_03880 [Burkholderiales bacterium]|nr:hypothetical protein [Burkholderiales bacterium]